VIRAALIAVALLGASQAEAAAQPMPRSQQNLGAPGGRQAAGAVHLRGLDTLNGTVRDLDAMVGETLLFGHLEITVDACRAAGSAAGGDSHAHLRIRDIREDRPRFVGWMFASSPALSALDHPRYDVWVVSCSSR